MPPAWRVVEVLLSASTLEELMLNLAGLASSGDPAARELLFTMEALLVGEWLVDEVRVRGCGYRYAVAPLRCPRCGSKLRISKSVNCSEVSVEVECGNCGFKRTYRYQLPQ